MNVSPKVTATAVSAAVATIVLWILSTLGVDAPAEVGAAIATVIATVAGWITRDKQRDAGAGKHTGPTAVDG